MTTWHERPLPRHPFPDLISPRDIDLDIPFPAGMSPDAAGAWQRNLDWAQASMLIPDETAMRRYLSWDIASLMSRWIPEATGEGLDIAVDMTVAATILDDQFDSRLAMRPDETARICAEITAVMAPDDPGPPASPLAGAFAHAWGRLIRGMPGWWQDLTREHWIESIDASVTEAENRLRGLRPSRGDYFTLRRRSGYVVPMIELAHRALGFTPPERFLRTPVGQAMGMIAVDVIDTTNDVHSVEKEEARGDFHNLVLVVERERSCTRAEALTEISADISAWTGEFQRLAAGLPDVYAALGLTRRERERADRHVQALRSAMRGHYDWSRQTGRYTAANKIPSSQQAFADVATAQP